MELVLHLFCLLILDEKLTKIQGDTSGGKPGFC